MNFTINILNLTVYVEIEEDTKILDNYEFKGSTINTIIDVTPGPYHLLSLMYNLHERKCPDNKIFEH